MDKDKPVEAAGVVPNKDFVAKSNKVKRMNTYIEKMCRKERLVQLQLQLVWLQTGESSWQGLFRREKLLWLENVINNGPMSKNHQWSQAECRKATSSDQTSSSSAEIRFTFRNSIALCRTARRRRKEDEEI